LPVEAPPSQNTPALPTPALPGPPLPHRAPLPTTESPAPLPVSRREGASPTRHVRRPDSGMLRSPISQGDMPHQDSTSRQAWALSPPRRTLHEERAQSDEDTELSLPSQDPREARLARTFVKRHKTHQQRLRERHPEGPTKLLTVRKRTDPTRTQPHIVFDSSMFRTDYDSRPSRPPQKRQRRVRFREEHQRPGAPSAGHALPTLEDEVGGKYPPDSQASVLQEGIDSHPASSPYRGIHNPGNMCHLIVTLQALASTLALPTLITSWTRRLPPTQEDTGRVHLLRSIGTILTQVRQDGPSTPVHIPWAHDPQKLQIIHPNMRPKTAFPTTASINGIFQLLREIKNEGDQGGDAIEKWMSHTTSDDTCTSCGCKTYDERQSPLFPLYVPPPQKGRPHTLHLDALIREWRGRPTSPICSQCHHRKEGTRSLLNRPNTIWFSLVFYQPGNGKPAPLLSHN